MMPVTPLHFGPALAIRELVGKNRFGIWAFSVTQITMDIEPVVRIALDLDGTLHQTTHNPPVGLLVALIAIACTWKWEKWSAVVGATFGIASHLYLDMLYHSDVAQAMAKWGVPENRGFDAEIICLLGFFFWVLFLGIRKAVSERLAKKSSGLPSQIDGIVDHVIRASKS